METGGGVCVANYEGWKEDFGQDSAGEVAAVGLDGEELPGPVEGPVD